MPACLGSRVAPGHCGNTGEYDRERICKEGNNRGTAPIFLSDFHVSDPLRLRRAASIPAASSSAVAGRSSSSAPSQTKS
jgi:hypothetical protein